MWTQVRESDVQHIDLRSGKKPLARISGYAASQQWSLKSEVSNLAGHSKTLPCAVLV
ncbi:MAG TPA: hypothetical protein VFY92_09150 [Hyphomicrobiaceae bacterium]|nr:hypothetical protein [Hyphomicrobiaceae bacterium]